MAKIEGLRIKNFKVLKDVALGHLWSHPNSQSLTPITAVIGKNGVGKSALFDAFGFLADALKLGVEEACDARGRGGFERMRTQGETGPIEFEVCYRATWKRPPYYLSGRHCEQTSIRASLCGVLERLMTKRIGQK